MNEKLQKLVDEMVERGVRFPEATREFERRFISRVLADSDGNLSKAADALGSTGTPSAAKWPNTA